MESNKKNLAKTALAALVLAASLPVAGQAATGTEVQGALLARGCQAKGGGGSCGAATSKNNYPSFGHGCGSSCGASSQSQASQDSTMGYQIPQGSSTPYEQQGTYRPMGVQHSCGHSSN